MMTQTVSVKSLAFRILGEMGAQTMGQKTCPTPATKAGQGAGQDPGAPNIERTRVPHCGSPQCAGCYDVGDGRKIHPPMIGEDYRRWLERWKPKGRPQ
jgi:hypothetical protein